MSDEFNKNSNDFTDGGASQNEQQYQQPQQNYYDPQNPPQPNCYNANPMPPQEEKASVGLAILSYLFPIVGLIIFLVQKEKRPKTAKVSGICALVSFLINTVLVIIIIASGALAMIAGLGEGVDEIYENGEIIEEFAENNITGGSRVLPGNVIDDYVCELKGAEVIKSYDDKDAVRITYNFKNNSDDTVNFNSELNARAFQNGVELQLTVAKDNAETNAFTELKPGAAVDVSITYELSDTTSDVNLEIEKWFDAEEGHIEATVTLNQ